MTLRSNVARDIADYLQDNIPDNGPYFADEWGKDEDGVIDGQVLIMDGTGEVSEFPEWHEIPMFTINFRSGKNQTSKQAYDNALTIHDFLANSTIETINDIDYSYFTTFAPLQILGRDNDNSRWLLFARYLTLRNTDQVV